MARPDGSGRCVAPHGCELSIARFAVVPVDGDVAVEYARLRSATEGLGRPVADNDVWIAATATANGLPIATLNRRHFEPLSLHGLTVL
jgi:predicted nucleic acid-binding protein